MLLRRYLVHLTLLAAAVGRATLPLAADDSVPSVSVAAQYEAIGAEYTRELTAALVEQKDRTRARELGRWREDRFRELVLTAEATDAQDLSLDDCAALAECCEYLNDPELSIRYAQLAIQADPSDERAYYSLVRSLLNLARTDDAEAEVWRIDREFPEDSNLRALHGFVFARLRFENRVDRALPHADANLSYCVGQSPRQAKLAEAAADFIPKFVEAYETAGRAEDARRVLREHLATVRQSIAAFPDLGDETGVDVAARQLGLLYLNCELTRVVESEQLAAVYGEWLKQTLERTRARPELFGGAYARALNYAVRRSSAIREFASIEEILHAAGEEREPVEGDPDSQSQFAAMTDQFQTLIGQLAHHRTLVGQAAPDWRGVDWLTVDRAVPPRGRLIILELWAPFSGRGLSGFQRLSEWGDELTGQEAQIVAVAPYSGFTWDAEERRALRNPDVDRDTEQKAMAECLRQLQIDVPVGLVPGTAALSEWYAVQFYPVHVLIDEEGQVREVVTGDAPEQLREFFDNVRRQLR